ncbi:choice-of-anchor Q domain-containing protein [Rubrivirga sp.]|uniref:choice-of-anchor Q domain-containing protein n=1 Tax=Rubrivirga sp. TaxID=1885344 RepID=UPI003B519985
MRLSSTLTRRLSQPILLTALVLAAALPASAAIITVNSSTDDGTGCTLREAVASANTDSAIGGCTAGDDSNDEIQFTVATVALAGPGLRVEESLTVSGPVTITAAPSRRIFRVGAPGDVVFDNITFRGGFRDGGAIAIIDASVTVTNCQFNSNRAPLTGGAIMVLAPGSLTVDGSSFTGNRSLGSSANEGGGAIYTDGAPVTVTNSTFTDNRALGTSGSGGAILSPNGATLTVENSTFTLNRSQRAGGAIETVGGTTEITGGTFDRNTAGSNPGNGGAVHGGGDVSITIRNSTAMRNRAQEGGAYWISGSGTLTLMGGTLMTNLAEGDDADKGGGGVYVDGGTLTVEMGDEGTTFVNNRAVGASGSGGAILVNGGSATLDSATFSENRSQRAGGAIEVTASDSGADVDVTIMNSAFTENVTAMAPGNGGAIHTTTGDVDLDIDDTEFSGNEAGSEGGAIWINTGTTLTLDNSTLSSNAARGRTLGNGGGGLYVNGGDATVTTTTIANNRTFDANSSGGGIQAVSGTTTVSQSLVSNNTSGNGGGLAAYSGASITVENSTVYANNARFGAGAFASDGSITFDSATIAENVASIAGGGLNTEGETSMTLRNTIVADNEATNRPNLRGQFESDGFNVIGTTPSDDTFPAQSSDQTGTDPMLEPLADNGGPTLTAALMSGSPAIDAGNTDLDVDQRGFSRDDGSDDVGAFEAGETSEDLIAAPSSALESMTEPVRLGVAPNPFGARASATFAVREAQPVTVALYDVMGRRVQDVFSGPAQAEGVISVDVDGSSLAAGVYVLVLQGQTVRATQQVTVTR